MADWSTVEDLQRRMIEAVKAMEQMGPSIGQARQIVEYNNDQKKRCLAIVELPLIKAGASAASAEIEARASPQYESALKQLAKELATAETVRAEYDNLRLQFEAARSLLSLQKESLRQL